MKKTAIIAAALCMALSVSASEKGGRKGDSPVKQEIKNHFAFYGFIRNFMSVDTRENKTGTGDLFYYLPLDENKNIHGDDLNSSASFRFLSLTTRLGVDVSGYSIGNAKFGAKVETDFYAGLSGTSTSGSSINGTAQLRMRLAYMTIGWDNLEYGRHNKASVALKMGQAWHPMAADQPHVTSLETGAPFNAFSRTPLIQADATFNKHVILSAAAIWQMQYLSQGPAGASAEYMKYSGVPEMYVGLSYKMDNGFLARAGASILSIKPRRLGQDNTGVTVKVSDRITTVNPYIYLQYTDKKFEVKAKTIYSQGGEHMNLMSGYGVTEKFNDGHWEYAPMQASSTWASASYGKKWQVMLMAGYIKNLGATKDLANVAGVTDQSSIYFSANGFKNLNSMWRIIPTVAYNVGKFTVALEYNITAAQYGGVNGQYILNARGLAKDDLHWVCNNRIQAMVRFSF